MSDYRHDDGSTGHYPEPRHDACSCGPECPTCRSPNPDPLLSDPWGQYANPNGSEMPQTETPQGEYAEGRYRHADGSTGHYSAAHWVPTVPSLPGQPADHYEGPGKLDVHPTSDPTDDTYMGPNDPTDDDWATGGSPSPDESSYQEYAND